MSFKNDFGKIFTCLILKRKNLKLNIKKIMVQKSYGRNAKKMVQLNLQKRYLNGLLN